MASNGFTMNETKSARFLLLQLQAATLNHE